MKRRLRRVLFVPLIAVLSILLPNPTAYADTIGGYPLRPVLSGTLATGNGWAAWAGTTLSVERPGGRIRWAFDTSLWVAINGQAASYSGKVAASVWVEQSTAECLFVACWPTTWNLMGPANQCWYTASPGLPTHEFGMGDRGCWPARSNLSYYRITAVVTWQVPLDSDTATDGQPTYHSVTLVSPAMLVRP